MLPFSLFFPDFGPDPDFFHEIGPEMARICIKKSGFDVKWMKSDKSLFLWYWSGFKAHLCPDWP